MKIICQAPKKDGGFHEIGTTHQAIFSHYKTVRGAIKYGIWPWIEQQGEEVARCLVFYDDHVYHDPDSTFYLQPDRMVYDHYVMRRIGLFLPRENALGRTARQIASELNLHSAIIDDVLTRMMQDNRLTYDATGYCRKNCQLFEETSHVTD